MSSIPPAVFGFAGFSGSGKTTLIEKLLPLLKARGLRVSVIKHAHHNFDMDVPGKDSWRHRQAGAHEVLITSAHRWVLLHELHGQDEPTLEQQLQHLAPCDLVLVEGFKYAPIPKIEIYRPSLGKPVLYSQDQHIIAVATDAEAVPEMPAHLPRLSLHDAARIADFICQKISVQPATTQR